MCEQIIHTVQMHNFLLFLSLLKINVVIFQKKEKKLRSILIILNYIVEIQKILLNEYKMFIFFVTI